MHIRQIQPGDTKQLLQLKLQLDKETKYMLFEPGERKNGLKDQQQAIDSLLQKGGMIFVAEHEGQLVGYLDAICYPLRRVRANTTIVIGIIQAFSHQGIGSALFIAMEEWARAKQLHRLELTVMTENRAAIALYKKRGFSIEGMRKDAFIVDKRYMDEYIMAKLL